MIQQENFKEQVKHLFEIQKNFKQSAKDTDAEERVALLKKFRAGVLKYKEDVANALYNDFQRPHTVTYAVEISTLLNHIDYTVNNLKQWLQREPVEAAYPSPHPFKAEIVYEPKGNVLIIGPWNVPFYLTLYPLISAIAGGNTAVIKPSELTPHNSAVIRKLIEEVFDERLVAVVEGGVNETTDLLALPFDHIYFTGSPKVGKIVMQAAAQHLTSVTLELGGKAPAVIDDTADIYNAAYRIIKGKVLNAGQICMNTDYVLIPEKLKSEFIDNIKTFISDAYITNGEFKYDDYDQIINEANYNRLKRLFDDAVSKGAKVALGGVFDDARRKIQPTVLTDVPLDAAIMNEEIFGPLLPIINYDTKEQAADIIRHIDKPLGLYIFSNDKAFIGYIINNTTAGGTAVNDVMIQAFDPAIPCGGVNNSGIGKGYGKSGFLELTNARSVLFQSSESENDQFLKAPYEGKEEIIKGMLK